MTLTARRRAGDDVLSRVDAWWRAANYLSVGQIYLLENGAWTRAHGEDHPEVADWVRPG